LVREISDKFRRIAAAFLLYTAYAYATNVRKKCSLFCTEATKNHREMKTVFIVLISYKLSRGLRYYLRHSDNTADPATLLPIPRFKADIAGFGLRLRPMLLPFLLEIWD